jgi:hypothetical protein
MSQRQVNHIQIEKRTEIKMAYSDFDLAKVKSDFGLTLREDENLFAGLSGVAPSELLQTILQENLPLAIAINSEKAKSEFLIAPILTEARRQLNYQVSLFSGKDFTVDSGKGLIPILAILTTDGFCSIKVYSFVICSQLKENWYKWILRFYFKCGERAIFN